MGFSEQIARLERRYQSIAKYLPYADGQAYYRDKQQMEEIEKEISRLKREMGDESKQLQS